MPTFRPRLQAFIRINTIIAVGLMAGASTLSALEVPKGEKEALKACERDVCTMIVNRKPSGPDLTCDISKTWAERDLNSGESKGISWYFGDARCELDLNIPRSLVVGALTNKKFKLMFPMHTVQCVVERNGKLEPVTIRIKPKIKFKGGKAKKVYLGVRKIKGPSDIEATVNTASTFVDKLGMFQGAIVKSVNKFIQKQCPKKYGAKS